MPELTFIFGPNNSFFFDSPKSWKFHNLPPTLRQLLNSSMSAEWRIAQPYCLALGSQINNPEPVWYCGCRVLDGQDKIFYPQATDYLLIIIFLVPVYSQTYFDLNYPDLSRWTKTIPNAPRACFITFGPGLSYFACAPRCGSIWAGISSELMDKVQKAFDTPSYVALGMDEAWFVLWPDGSVSWKFYGNYGGLDEILTKAFPGSVSYVSISPYHKEQYFVAFTDRTVKYNFTGAPEWIPQIQEVFNEWQVEVMQAQQRQQQQQYYGAPSHLNLYLPSTEQPAYVAAHYADIPIAQLPGSVPQYLAPPPAAQRPLSVVSSTKKRGFLSRRKKSNSEATPPQAPVNTAAQSNPISQGSQECAVM